MLALPSKCTYVMFHSFSTYNHPKTFVGNRMFDSVWYFSLPIVVKHLGIWEIPPTGRNEAKSIRKLNLIEELLKENYEDRTSTKFTIKIHFVFHCSEVGRVEIFDFETKVPSHGFMYARHIQDCQTFLGSRYQNLKKCTKSSPMYICNVPNGHKFFPVKYSKCP
jgi:hypothetical protein